ncbi:YlcI/YnfO family protein [Enterobacter sp. ENT03]|uniref:YlcI/YnfO family protein n=1 Tax=Enterobacter sp. ENT03 TaxID=2854780 RepID=UPI001C448E5E|nr:YlcI/YnfO family protein [Enterobacter sp. ENT03]MBV7404879.1 YlcI/YnfO family protein [Enterobacter sp. ENT03]
MQEKKKPHFDRTKSTMKNIRFEDELLEQIEKAAGKGNFSKWVKEACKMRLQKPDA